MVLTSWGVFLGPVELQQTNLRSLSIPSVIFFWCYLTSRKYLYRDLPTK